MSTSSAIKSFFLPSESVFRSFNKSDVENTSLSSVIDALSGHNQQECSDFIKDPTNHKECTFCSGDGYTMYKGLRTSFYILDSNNYSREEKGFCSASISTDKILNAFEIHDYEKVDRKSNGYYQIILKGYLTDELEHEIVNEIFPNNTEWIKPEVNISYLITKLSDKQSKIDEKVICVKFGYQEMNYNAILNKILDFIIRKST